MHRYFYLSILFILTLGCFSPQAALSQSITDPEAEYARIRSMASLEDYAGAEVSARNLVRQYPGYGDARILLGRILAWQNNYEEAESVIDTLLLTEPDNRDALAAVHDIKRWSRKAAEEDTPPTDIRAGYTFDTYKTPYDRFWQVFNAGAGHRFSWGTVVAGVNAGNIIIGEPANINATDLQYSVEAWPTLSKSNYAYMAYAYSPGTYFPRHRAALELWQTLPAGWAVSAGVNYYHFTDDIFIGTLSLEKYLGNWWLSGRGYFYLKDIGVTTSFYLNARRYFNKTDYLQLTLGTGTAPDEPFDIMTDLERQSANSIRLSYFDRITPLWAVRVGAGFSYEEYTAGFHRKRFEGGIGFIYSVRMKR